MIPTFILYTISPLIYPIYDQHVERAKRVLLAQDIHFGFSDMNILSYSEYQQFFSELLKEFPQPSIGNLKNWGFVKWMKPHNQIKQIKIKQSNDAVGRFTPDEDFKREVLNR